MANLYIADCHFGHSEVLLFDHRPFSDIVQMEEGMCMLWNSAVQKSDTVYILGDFISGNTDERLRIVRKLNGTKVLIKGNHDPTYYPNELKKHFLEITRYKEIVDKNRKVILSHFPLLFHAQSGNPQCYMLCGHVHNSVENKLLEKWVKELHSITDTSFKPCGQIINVGCMLPWMRYTPRTLDEIVMYWKKWHTEQNPGCISVE